MTIKSSKTTQRQPQSALEILAPSSPLPTFPRITPLIFVELRPEIFRVTGGRELQQVAQESLLDPRFVFLLRGVRCGTKIFWNSSFNFYYFIDAESGKRFHRENLPEEQRFVLLLMEDGSYPPRCKKNPYGYLLSVFCKSSAQQVTGGRVRAVGPVSSEKENWNEASRDFLEKFANAAAK